MPVILSDMEKLDDGIDLDGWYAEFTIRRKSVSVGLQDNCSIGKNMSDWFEEQAFPADSEKTSSTDEFSEEGKKDIAVYQRGRKIGFWP